MSTLKLIYASSEGEKCVGAKMRHLQASQSEFPFWEFGVSDVPNVVWEIKTILNVVIFLNYTKDLNVMGVALSKQIS